MHKRRLRWNSHVSPPKPESGKVWHGRNRNQGVVGERDEQYQMPIGTWVSSGLRQKRWYPPLQLSQSSIWLTSSFLWHTWHGKSSGGIHVDVMMVGLKFGRWQGAQFLEWSRIVCPSAPCNSNTPKALIALILKIVRLEEVSRVSLGCR
jgi:hypothetical protein